MEKKIILVLAQKKFYKIDKHKFEVDDLRKKNVKVELHELVDFISPKIKNTFQNELQDNCVSSFKSFSEWRFYLSKVIKQYKKKNIFIFNFILPHNFQSFLVNYFIKKKLKLQVIEFSGDDHPVWEKTAIDKILDLNLFLNTIFQFLKNPKKIKIFLESKLYIFISKIFQLKTKYHLIFSEKELAKLKNKNKDNVILGNSLDQNLFLTQNNKNFFIDKSLDYALFLESANPIFNGDNELLGVNKDSIMTVESWTNSLKLFFDFLEKELKLKVLISPHPRVKHHHEYPDYYFGRKVLKDFAYIASKNAKLIITRQSTGISYGILNNIPIMTIYSDEIKRNKSMLSKSFHISNKLGKNPINIDNFDKESLRNEAFKINKSKYQDYKKNYITLRNDDKKNSEVLLEIMNKKSLN